MLRINEENVLKDLSIIRSKLNNATLEECVDTLQLLAKSILFLKEKKSNSYPENEWNDYCKIKYNLGKHFVEIIHLYNERLSLLLNERYDYLNVDNNNSDSSNKQKQPEETVETNSIIKPQERQSSQNSLPEELPNSPPEYSETENSRVNSSNSLSVSVNNDSSSYNVYYYPPSPNPDALSRRTTVITNNNNGRIQSSNTISYPPGQNLRNEDVNRRSTVHDLESRRGGYVSSPVSTYADVQITSPHNEINPPTLHSSYDSELNRSSSYISTSASNIQDDDNDDDFTDETDGIIGKYLCIKEFKAKEDFQIDLQLNDIVTINQFTGKYILGKNCRTRAEGLFPIYYIDSLDGNYIFFRCKEEMEFANIDDEIFLLREADNEYYPGYNITKGEQGIFNLTKLDPVIIDNDKLKEIESLYEDKSTTSNSNEVNTRSNTVRSYGSYNSGISGINSVNNDNSFDLANNNSVIGPLLPTSNSDAASQIQNMEKDFVDYSDMSENNKIDQSIIEKLLDYYKTIPNIQDNKAFDKDEKTKKSTDNNLGLMRDAIKKFQEFRTTDDEKKPEVIEKVEKKDNFLPPSVFEDIETKNRKWEANRYRCQELVDTERSYCDKMRIMIEKFMKPLEDAVETENEMLNRVQISLIFKNIPDIYEFSKKLHEDLAAAFARYDEEGPIPIATVFLDKFSEWKIYIKYVEDFHSASATLENLKKTPQTDRFNRFMEQCQKSEECNKSHLKDLIVLPIQRFLKYRLLFEGIKKDSDPRDQESYQLLDTVENYIFEIGEIMNNAKRIQENINKMFSLEKAIMNYPPELISYTQRSFIAEWNVNEIKQKRLYLFSDTVLFANILTKKSKKLRKYKYIYEKRIDILDYDVVKNTATSKRVIKFKATERLRTSKTFETKTTRSFSTSHSHSLLGFSLGGHSTGYTVPITKSLIFFDTEEECNDFYNKYNEQKNILIKNKNNTQKNNSIIDFDKKIKQ